MMNYIAIISGFALSMAGLVVVMIRQQQIIDRLTDKLMARDLQEYKAAQTIGGGNGGLPGVELGTIQRSDAEELRIWKQHNNRRGA